jgi:phosphoglycerate dehydrogenase-like enzyme
MKVLVLSSLWPSALDRLAASHDTRVELKSTPESLPSLMRDAEIAVVRSGVRLDQAALSAANHLRLIVRAGGGLDGIDCEFARQRGIRIISVPLSAQSVAEHAISLALALSHRVVQHHMALAVGRWEKHSGYGRNLFGRQLGLLGFGRIGQRIGEIGRALGMNAIAYDRSPDKSDKQLVASQIGARFVGLDELFAQSEILIIQAPLNSESRRLVDAAKLALMRADALLINVGRGGIVDEAALFAALESKQLGGAALDVFEQEPPGKHPLFQLPHFIGTPHVAAQTEDAQRTVGENVVKILDAFASQGDWTAHGVLIV